MVGGRMPRETQLHISVNIFVKLTATYKLHIPSIYSEDTSKQTCFVLGRPLERRLLVTESKADRKGCSGSPT